MPPAFSPRRSAPPGTAGREGLANLDAVGAERRRFIALPLRIDGADSSPVRAIALVE